MGDETALNAFEVLSTAWAECGVPSGFLSDDRKGGFWSFVLMKGVCVIIKMVGNIKQSCEMETAIQLLEFIDFYNEKQGI